MTTPLPDVAAVRRALDRKYLTAAVNGVGSPPVTNFPVAATEVAMSVVGPVLEERDAEIGRLRGIVAEWVTGKTGSGEER